MLKLYSIGVLAFVSALSAPVLAQSGLSEQQDRCDMLREMVDDARATLDSRQRIDDLWDNSGINQDALASGRQVARILGSSTGDAERSYRRAMEQYQLQGCSMGGSSSYQYYPD